LNLLILIILIQMGVRVALVGRTTAPPYRHQDSQ